MFIYLRRVGAGLPSKRVNNILVQHTWRFSMKKSLMPSQGKSIQGEWVEGQILLHLRKVKPWSEAGVGWGVLRLASLLKLKKRCHSSITGRIWLLRWSLDRFKHSIVLRAGLHSVFARGIIYFLQQLFSTPPPFEMHDIPREDFLPLSPRPGELDTPSILAEGDGDIQPQVCGRESRQRELLCT